MASLLRFEFLVNQIAANCAKRHLLDSKRHESDPTTCMTTITVASPKFATAPTGLPDLQMWSIAIVAGWMLSVISGGWWCYSLVVAGYLRPRAIGLEM